MTFKAYLKKYVDYIKNAHNPTSEQFDEDWEPIGQTLRNDLTNAGLIYENNGRLFIRDTKK